MGFGLAPRVHDQRVTSNFSPTAERWGGSEGMYDRFRVKVLILDTGADRVVLIRSPLVFTTDFMVTQITQRVLEKTGVDYVNKVIMVSTHSHSAPGRYWNLLPHLHFGAMGGGDFHPEVFTRMVASFAKAVISAHGNMVDGKLGYAINENFDVKKRVFSNRRGMSSGYRHPHLLVMRVEKADGTPLAAVVSFPMHGTISENTFMTNDSTGGLEFVLQEKLETAAKKRVEVFFLQGCAGDISPRGDHLGHKSTQKMQMLGHNAVPEILALYNKIKTKSDVSMELVSKRIPISRKHMGYKDGEFYEIRDGEKRPFRYGAFQCVQKGFSFTKEPNARHEDGNLKCIFSVELLHSAPVPQFSKTHLSALRIDDLYITTMPGEGSAFIAKKLREDLLAQSKGKIKKVIVLGYAQDHQLYLLREEDWMRGGYESSLSVWGPKLGEYLVREATSLALQLTTPEKEKNDTGILPQSFLNIDHKRVFFRGKTPGAGTIVIQPPKTYKRLDKPFKFEFSGGHAVLGNPYVYLQKKEGADFKDVMRPGGQRKYDDGDYRMRMEFRKFAVDQYLYTYFFEELQDFPTGTYRFRIEGQKWDGQKKVPYTAQTDPFEIVPTDQLWIRDLKLTDKAITGRISFPPGTTDDGKSPFPKIETIGHRLRSPLVHRDVGPPLPEKSEVLLKITIAQGGKTLETLETKALNVHKTANVRVVTSRAKDGSEKTRNQSALISGFDLKLKAPLKPGTYQISVEIKGPHGNTGKWGPKDLKF